jgi:hypothetical protein
VHTVLVAVGYDVNTSSSNTVIVLLSSCDAVRAVQHVSSSTNCVYIHLTGASRQLLNMHTEYAHVGCSIMLIRTMCSKLFANNSDYY